MKKLSIAVLSMVAVLGMTDVANAKTSKAFASRVTYSCQGGKSVGVTYNFNKQGLPTSASAVLNGRNRHIPINLDTSDNVDTFFGKEGNYSISTSYMNNNNYRRISGVNIFSPNSNMLYKDCSPR